jgi:hypothetical protein
MKTVADELRITLQQVLPHLEKIPNEEASLKPLPHKWSKKEILGHLIDSANNNQQKFVRTMAQKHLDFVGYEQDFWVAVQHYQSRNWLEIIALWYNSNLQIAHIIENVKSEALQNTIRIEDAGPFTLEFIMRDYIEHLKHHLRQVLPEIGLTSNFGNVYNA